MAIIQWDDALSVNIVEVDGQHQKLIAMINSLYDAMRQGKSGDVIEAIVNGLIDYAEEHFALEEGYFDQYGYPDAESHKVEHLDFITKTLDFVAGFDKGEAGLSSEILSFLSDWLQNHIRLTDKRYSKFLNEKGLK